MTNDYNPHTHELISARGEKGRHRKPRRSTRDCKATRSQESPHNSCMADPAQRFSKARCEAKNRLNLGLDWGKELGGAHSL